MSKPSFFSIALSPQVFPRAIRVALIVGTILAVLNHGEKLLSASLTASDFIKIVLTYFVPYSVSTWSSVVTIRAAAEIGK